LLPAAPIRAEPIRVTTWDLQPAAVASAFALSNELHQSRVREAADSLKKLSPDILILQHVADWETCHQLAQALQPETYQVAICSSFRDARAKPLRGQVAVLSKASACLAWSEPWQNSGPSPVAPGGFAFAAIRLGDKNVGVFSVQLGEAAASGADGSRRAASQLAREESARQLVRQIASLQNWKTNRLQAFIVAGDFDARPDDLPLARQKTFSCLEQAGFENAFTGLPSEKLATPPAKAHRPAATLDFIFTRDAGLLAPLLVTQIAPWEHDAVTFETDLVAHKAAPAPAVIANATAPARYPQTLFWIAGFLACCLALFVFARKLARRPELQPPTAALLELKAKTGPSMAAPRADRIILAPPSNGLPSVHIAAEGFTQTQSQNWRPCPDVAPVAGRMPVAVRAGVIASLSRWLKQMLVRQLVSDRAQLLATQQAAALKVLAVDERLAKIERHIQQRNQEYEQRIDDLLKELVTAREENRALIRAKIALLKAEMEKARLKAAPHTHEQQ
jgi:endonuclease/exonuclease/phosphatase family metal-dependent hydrolase